MVSGHFRPDSFIPPERAFGIPGISGLQRLCGRYGDNSLLHLSAFERCISQTVCCLMHSTGYSGYDECMNNSKTPSWSTDLESLPVSRPFKKFPAFYGTRSFITAFTSARHLSLTLAIANLSTSWKSSLI